MNSTHPIHPDGEQPKLLFVPYWIRATLKRENKSYSTLFNRVDMERIFSLDDIAEFNSLQRDIMDLLSSKVVTNIVINSELSESLVARTTSSTPLSAIDLLNDQEVDDKNNIKTSLKYERLVGRTLGDNQYIGFKLIDISNNDGTYVGFTTYVIEGTIHDVIASRKQFIVDMIHALWSHGFPLSKLVQLGLFRHYTI